MAIVCARAAPADSKSHTAPERIAFGVRNCFKLPPRFSVVVGGKQRGSPSPLAGNHDPVSLIADGQAEAAMQQQDEDVYIVGLEASADANLARIAFHQYLPFVVAIELLRRFRQGLLIEDQHAAAP